MTKRINNKYIYKLFNCLNVNKYNKYSDSKRVALIAVDGSDAWFFPSI